MYLALSRGSHEHKAAASLAQHRIFRMGAIAIYGSRVKAVKMSCQRVNFNPFRVFDSLKMFRAWSPPLREAIVMPRRGFTNQVDLAPCHRHHYAQSDFDFYA